MSLRLLFGALASGLSDWHNDLENIGAPETGFQAVRLELSVDLITEYMSIYSGPAKFHIAMLTISLLTGLAYGGFVAYSCWMEKDAFLAYIRNLVVSLVFRTFFSIIFDGVVLLGVCIICKSPYNVGGGNTVSAFEQICLNLAISFWLSFTIYLHARVQRNFNSEPTLRLYQYGVPAVGAFFAFIWIFTLHSSDISRQTVWWLARDPIRSWIVNSINLLYLLVQLVLVIDIARMMVKKKSSFDNDSASLSWKIGAVLGLLVLLFWLQFGLSLALCPPNQSYLYFYYFIDGLECALICVCLYFFNQWVALRIGPRVLSESCETITTEVHDEGLLTRNGDRRIVTIDSLFMTDESGTWKNPQNGAKDVVYSSVVEPLRLKKTLELYKRLSLIPGPKPQVTVVEGEKFYDCQTPGESKTNTHRTSQSYKSTILTQEIVNDINSISKNDTAYEKSQKKNAFYASKYLILEPKGDLPKYLETHPSATSTCVGPSGGRNINISDELVKKWFNSTSAQKYDKVKTMAPMEEHQKKSSSQLEAESKPGLLSETALDVGTPRNLVRSPQECTSSDAFLNPESVTEAVNFLTEKWGSPRREMGPIGTTERFPVLSRQSQSVEELNVEHIRKPDELLDEGVISDFQKNQTELSDTSSDSEFSIENKFSVEEYCGKVIADAAKFNNKLTPIKINAKKI